MPPAWTESSNIDLVEDEVYPNWDVAYTNDALERLAQAYRGTWNGSAITSPKFDEQWTLSQTGNWEHYILDLNGNGTYTDTGDLNDDQTFNKVNELTARDTDDNGTDNFSLVYDDMGNLTDDGEDYEYVYDVWGRLRKVKDQSSTLVAEYTYNGLGHRIGWHYDVTDDGTTGLPDGAVDADDPWFHFVYDDSWRIVATYRADHASSWTIDSDPKERFVYHNAGLDGFGGSSYIDAVILRERDADNTGGWAGSPDGTLEERTYYVQNWRADVVALFTDAGQLIQQVRYDPYGVPFGLAKADVNGDGSVNTADVTAFGNIWNGGNGTHPYADWNFDGAVNTADYSAFLNSHANDTALGRGMLGYSFGHAGGNSRKGYAGYEEALELEGVKPGTYHVRHRVYIAELGRWTRRDPIGYVDGTNLYLMGGANPLIGTDWDGLAYASGGGGCGAGCSGRSSSMPRTAHSNDWFETCWNIGMQFMPAGLERNSKCYRKYLREVGSCCGTQVYPKEHRPGFKEASDCVFDAIAKARTCLNPPPPSPAPGQPLPRKKPWERPGWDPDRDWWQYLREIEGCDPQEVPGTGTLSTESCYGLCKCLFGNSNALKFCMACCNLPDPERATCILGLYGWDRFGPDLPFLPERPMGGSFGDGSGGGTGVY